MARRNQDLALTPSMPGTFLPLAHPTLVSRPPSGVGWIHEIKFDGYRFQLNVQSGRATWFTRNGHDWTQKLPLHSAAAAMLEDCVLDGELCALDDAGQPALLQTVMTGAVRLMAVRAVPIRLLQVPSVCR